jgi:IMP dehydrogenase
MKDAFFKAMEAQGLALTFDDVRLRSGYSEVLPEQVSLRTRFSRRVGLNIPIVSAAMDTVTESGMAMALAKLGGLGVIHKNLLPKEQEDEVQRVKFHLSGVIRKPITVRTQDTIAEIRKRREERHFSFFTFPVLDEAGRLAGLLTQNDFDFCENAAQAAEDVMTRDLITASASTTFDEAYRLMHQNKKKVLPLVDGDGALVGMYLFSDLARIKSGSSDAYNVDDQGRLRVAIAMGVYDDAFARAELMAEKVDVFVIDTAHGHSRGVLETVRELKSRYPQVDIVAGNVSEPDAVEPLIEAGIDGLKVGQGGGSICTTRIVAGIGCPQISAVYRCAVIARMKGVPVCSDGGVANSGDIPLAIGAGADSVMLGRLLAGTKEAPGDIEWMGDRPMKKYRGMGSLGAMEARKGSRERYQQGGVAVNKLVPEGVEGVVPYTGELEVVLHQYLGGLRAGMGYVGAATIPDLQEKADFHRISSAGQAESHPHDIRITRDAPNYQRSKS